MADEFRDRVGRYLHYRTGDVLRHLAFAGIVIIWIFKTDGGGVPRLPSLLLVSGLFLAVALAVDLLHYAAKWSAGAKREGEIGESGAPPRMAGWEVWAVRAKVLLVASAYVLICCHFVQALQGRSRDADSLRSAWATAVNSAGLVIDIVGAVLLFLFGLPPAINREGHGALVREQVEESIRHRAVRYDRFGRLGMALIVAGFLCQFVGGLLK